MNLLGCHLLLCLLDYDDAFVRHVLIPRHEKALTAAIVGNDAVSNEKVGDALFVIAEVAGPPQVRPAEADVQRVVPEANSVAVLDPGACKLLPREIDRHLVSAALIAAIAVG